MKGNMYMIYSNDHNDIYIGSTEKSIEVRLKRHEYDYKQYLIEKTHYITSFDIVSKGNYKIKLIEQAEYESVKQLYKQEGNVIKTYKKDAKYNVVNKIIVGRTVGQYYIDNKAKLNVKTKEYRINNKDKIKIHKSTKNQCVCGGCYTNCHKQMHMRTSKHMQYQQPTVNININIVT